jgi:kynurenine formamidase
MPNRRACLITLLVLRGFSASAAGVRGQDSDPLAQVFQAIGAGRVTVVDLTHPVDEQSPYWPEGAAESPFHAPVVSTIERGGYFARNLTIPEHFGTHMDAPAHFDPRGVTVDQLPVKNYLRPASVVDVSQAAKTNRDYRLSVADLENWEKAHGAPPDGCVVLIRTGWGERWPSQQRVMNQDAQGVLHFPGLSVEAARYLINRVHPVAIGIDTPSIDFGPSKNFDVHQITMSAGLYHLENVANLEQLPAVGAYVIALPLKLRGGSGSPARVLALFWKGRDFKRLGR